VAINGITDMKKQVLQSTGGLWYSLWEPTIKHELNNTLFACVQGSGEYGSYTAADMYAEVSRVTEKNGFAQDAANGIELPFWVISPMASKGADQADHRLISKELGSVVKLHKKEYAFLSGLSLGGQTAAGFLFQCKNGTELSKGLESSFVNAQVFDGIAIFCGKIPGTPDVCAFPEMPVFIVGCTGDTAVPISNQWNILNKANSCPLRTDKIYANYDKNTLKAISVDDDILNRFMVILGGSHSTSWTMSYDWYAKSGPGYELNRWVTKIAKPVYKPIECSATLDDQNGFAVFHLPEGDKKYLISPV